MSGTAMSGQTQSIPIIESVIRSNKTATIISETSVSDKGVYNFQFTLGEASQTPSWRVENGGEPPLSPIEAMLIAQVEIKKYVLDVKRYRLYDIKLNRLNTSGKWIYWVEFMDFAPPLSRNDVLENSVRIGIFMNGKPVTGESIKADMSIGR